MCLRQGGGEGGGLAGPHLSSSPPTPAPKAREIFLRFNPLAPQARMKILPPTVKGEERGGGGASSCGCQPRSDTSLGVGGGGGWNSKVQKFVYQRQPKSIFPFVNFIISHNEVRGGGGVSPPPPNRAALWCRAGNRAPTANRYQPPIATNRQRHASLRPHEPPLLGTIALSWGCPGGKKRAAGGGCATPTETNVHGDVLCFMVKK